MTILDEVKGELEEVKARFETDLSKIREAYFANQDGLSLFFGKQNEIKFAIDIDRLKKKD